MLSAYAVEVHITVAIAPAIKNFFIAISPNVY
jgi:hypothetical protein